jgi:hypothetical protein
MRWKHPHHTWWLAACFAGLALSALAGGLSGAVLAVFLVIFLVGAALIWLDDVVVVAVFAGSAAPAADDVAADRITVIDTTDAVRYPDDDPDDGDPPAQPAAETDETAPADEASEDQDVGQEVGQELGEVDESPNDEVAPDHQVDPHDEVASDDEGAPGDRGPEDRQPEAPPA